LNLFNTKFNQRKQLPIVFHDTGVSGDIYINANGDREMDLVLMDLDPETGEFQARHTSTQCYAFFFWQCAVAMRV
jgi:hypothetical protein